MAKRILVPLDKSETSEAVLPLVAGMAASMGATVRLLHVEPEAREFIDSGGRVIVYIDQDAARLEADGMDYLADVAGRLPGAAVERVVRFGDPVREILGEAEAFGADLIAVTTTGRSGLRRAVLGSVAEQVFSQAMVPVLLYHNNAPGH
jgi:nucleotide-binding universal stress UspA family protein